MIDIAADDGADVDYVVQVRAANELGMPSIEERALPELKLGGMRFSPDLLFPTRMDSNGGRMGTAPLLLELPAPGSDAAPAGLAFVGLPAGHALSFVTWAPTGGKLAFMARPGGQASAHYELWIADWATGAVACRQLLPSHRFNAVTGPPLVFSKDGERLLVKTVPASLGPVPAAPAAPPGPTIQDNSDGAAAAARTYQDMISSPHDEMLFAHCSTCALLLLTLSSGEALTVGPAEGMMLRGSHAPSNSGMVDGALAVSPGALAPGALGTQAPGAQIPECHGLLVVALGTSALGTQAPGTQIPGCQGLLVVALGT